MKFIPIDKIDYENDYTVYVYNDDKNIECKYYLYNADDARMVSSVDKDDLVYFVPTELTKYLLYTPYVKDLI